MRKKNTKKKQIKAVSSCLIKPPLKLPKITLRKTSIEEKLSQSKAPVVVKEKIINQKNFDTNTFIQEPIKQLEEDKSDDLNNIETSLEKSCLSPNNFHFNLGSMNLYKYLGIFFEKIDSIQKAISFDFQLQKNFLSDIAIAHFSKKLEKFENIRHLSLNFEHNYIGGLGLIAFSKALKNFPFLSRLSLNLTWIGIKEIGISKMNESFRMFKSLYKLELLLDWNSLTLPDFLSLIMETSNLQTLVFLNLSFVNTGFNDDFCLALSNFLENLPNLQYLNLNLKWNEITDEGFSNLIQEIFKKGRSLRQVILNLDNNKISDIGLLCLCSVMKLLKNLMDFEIRIYDNLIDLSYLVFVEEILRQKWLFSSVFHLGKCIYNEDKFIIAKTESSDLLKKLQSNLKFKSTHRKSLLFKIMAIKSSKLKKIFRREIIDEIIDKY